MSELKERIEATKNDIAKIMSCVKSIDLELLQHRNPSALDFAIWFRTTFANQLAMMESLARMEEESGIQIQVANEVKEGSWINEPRFAAFKKAYLKASGSTRAIPALAKCTPEEMYFAYEAIKTYEDYP